MGDRAQREAWVTLATNDAYALGCLVLGNSLRRVNTTRRLVVMVSNGISEGMRNQLQGVFDSLVDVSVLDSEDARNLSLLGRPDLNVTFTKIHCWKLVEYDKCVFLDADTLVLQNSDELFDREEFSAAPDAGWPDCFNSGVFVFCPSLETYQALLSFAGTTGSFDGGDQGLLNSFFNTWATEDIAKHLPFIYNVVSQAFYSYLPAFTEFRNSIKIVHFIGPIKPWNHPYNTATRTVTVFPETGHCQEFLQIWWDIFMGEVQPRLDPTVGGLVGELAQLKVGDSGDSEDFMVLDDRERRLAWERGHADYMGMDKFENIQRKLDEKMAPTPSKESLKKPEGSPSESSITKPAEVNEMDDHSGVVSVDSVPPVSVVAVSSVSAPSEPAPPEVKPDLPSPVAGGEGEVAACYAEPPVAVPIALAQPVPVAEEVSEPSSAETVELTSSLEAPVAVPATVPVAPHEAEPVVSASVSLGGGVGGEAEEVTETVTLGSSSATFVAAPVPAPAAEASISLSGPAAPVPEPSPQEPASTSFTMPLAPQPPAPVAEPPPPAVTSVSIPSKAPPVPEKKVPTPLGKPQEKLTPLQIGKKPPPPTPEKPASPAGVVGPKSPPPPVAQKPTSPVSPGGSKAPPLAPAKPASPAATSIAAQRSMFEKPAPDPSKPAPRVGGSVSAFAARFQQPPAQTPMSRPTPGVVPKPTSPTSPGVAPKPTSPTSPGVGPKPTSPSAASAAPPSAPSSSSSSAGQGSKNAEFLARFGLKKK